MDARNHCGEIRKIEDNIGQAALSPDGSRIVFEREQKLWQMGPNAEDPVPIVEAPQVLSSRTRWIFELLGTVWSSDGHWLTYLRKTGETDPIA